MLGRFGSDGNWAMSAPSADFDEFYRSTFAGLVATAVGVLGHRVGAEDVVQETMLDAHRRWGRIGTYDNPRAWVRRGVVQRAVKLAAKRTNERVAHQRAAGVATAEELPPRLDPELCSVLRELPAQQRAAVALHYLEDASVREIATVLGIAEGTVKVHLSRGRAALSALLAEDGSHGDA